MKKNSQKQIENVSSIIPQTPDIRKNRHELRAKFREFSSKHKTVDGVNDMKLFMSKMKKDMSESQKADFLAVKLTEQDSIDNDNFSKDSSDNDLTTHKNRRDSITLSPN